MEDSNKKITLNFKLLTGGTFTVSVESDISVDLLKKIVSKKLKINKERICLMNSERELQDGTLKDNGIIDGSKIIVTPNVETGLAQRTENTVMQALESLNDNQVNDFLSGKSPLNLSVRLGDHMMLIQLQLSTLSPSQQNSLKQKVANAAVLKQQAASHSIIECGQNRNIAQPSTSRKRSIDAEDEMNADKQRVKTDDLHNDDHTKSPIKSLSSMVSSPLTTTVQNMNQNNNKFWGPPSVDPIAAKLTSCLCKRLNISCNNNCEHTPESGSGESSSSYSTNHDTHNVIQPVRSIPFHQRPSTSIVIKPKPSQSSTTTSASTSTASDNTTDSGVDQQLLNTDNPALAEASRNLTQTLRKLSKRVFTSKTHLMDSSSSSSSASSSRKASSSSNTQSASVAGSSGAVIESMKHHGKGIYSGTFSGTLNPALQDKNGRPKRDISTIIHILNDLLSATPQCARNGAKIFFEPTQSSSSSGGKFIKVKKQISSKTSCFRCVPSLHSQSQQKCAYGQCNGHLKSDVASTSNTSSSLIPSTSTGITHTHYCSGCTQSLSNRKSAIENMKTKSKLDQLKLVMQQKKERREARKANIAPYAVASSIGFGSQLSSAPVTVAEITPMSSLNGSLVNLPGTTTSTSHMNDSTDANTSSSTTATAIATTISTNSSEIENHLEEVDTVA